MTSHELVEALEEPLSESVDAARTRERSRLDGLLETANGRVVLFGAGGLGRQTLACLRSTGIDPLAITDNNSQLWGGQVEGVRVLSPTEAATCFGGDALFIVSIWNPRHWYRHTHEKLASLGCRWITPPSPVYWKFADEFLPFFAQDHSWKVLEQRDAVRTCGALWADSRSRQEYLRQVLWRVRGAWTFTPIEDAAEQASYFLRNIFTVRPDEVFVDCGAFDGDTLREYLTIQPEGFDRFVALEPDAATFAKLETYVDSLPAAIRQNVQALRCAVGRERGRVSFDATGGLGSRVSSGGTTAVDLLPIPEVVDPSVPVTFIKMDIEGAEMDALEGARPVIERDRPILAVCVYHLQSDLWRLPLLIQSMSPDYRMFLRCHEGDGWQTVAYAVPRGRCIAANDR